MRKLVSSIISILVVLSLATSVFAFSSINLKSINLDKKSITISVGKTYILKAILNPTNTTQKLLKYSTSNKLIANVDATGKIVALKPGKATITVSSAVNKKIVSTCVVTVTQAKIITLRLVSPDFGRIKRDDNPVVKEVEKKINIKLNYQLILAAEFKNKYSLLVASGDVPDISRIPGFDFQQFAAQGIYMDVSPYIKNTKNLIKNIKEESWNLCQYQGKQYAIPYENAAGKYVQATRQDWLDNLGLKVPTNLEEYSDMLKKFTFNDPDKNGKDDTYGLIGFGISTDITPDFYPIFGAFGIIPGQHYVVNGKIYSSMIMPEYRAALEYIKQLWDAKVIDPDFFTIKADQANQRLAQSKAGSFCAWWSMVPETLHLQLKMKEINPNVKWVPIFPGIKGKSAKSGMPSMGSVGGTVSISSKSKNAEAAIKLLDFLDSDEGYELTYWGIKGVHYMEPGTRTEAGTTAFNEKWLDSITQVMNRFDLYVKWMKASTDPANIERIRYIDTALKYNLYSDAFYGVPATEEKFTLEADLKKYQVEMFVKFITGQESLSKWDDYVNTWKVKGGQKILDSMVKNYNKLKATNYSAGY